MTRRFIDAPNVDRCTAVIRLRDGSTADCGRRRTVGGLCTQHAKIAARLRPGQLHGVPTVGTPADVAAVIAALAERRGA